MKKFDIIALGECLIDFVSVKGKEKDKLYLEGSTGGAPANVLAAASRLGRSTSFIGKVGKDSFGQFAMNYVAESGVDTSAMVTGNQPTTLAMVTLDSHGDRSFSFYRHGTADVMLEQDEIQFQLIEHCRIFHFGSVSMTTDPARSSTIAAAQAARKAGVMVSFDPNYRAFLWESEQDAIRAMEQGIELADYAKLSDEEATMITGEKDPEKAALSLITKYELKFVAVTLGPKGCVGISPAARVKLPTYDLPVVDTTAAGDAFWGAALHSLLKYGAEQPLSEKKLTSLLQFSNASGSLATTKRGAIPSLATEEEILHCIKTAPLLLMEE